MLRPSGKASKIAIKVLKNVGITPPKKGKGTNNKKYLSNQK